MAASFIEWARNKLLATDETVDGDGNHVHTLIMTAGSAGTESFVELGRNQKFATDMVVDGDGNEVHTLKVLMP